MQVANGEATIEEKGKNLTPTTLGRCECYRAQRVRRVLGNKYDRWSPAQRVPPQHPYTLLASGLVTHAPQRHTP